jgi:hypothetical protein
MSDDTALAAGAALHPADSTERERLSTIESVMMAWKALDLSGKQASLVWRNAPSFVVCHVVVGVHCRSVVSVGDNRIKRRWK